MRVRVSMHLLLPPGPDGLETKREPNELLWDQSGLELAHSFDQRLRKICFGRKDIPARDNRMHNGGGGGGSVSAGDLRW